MTLASALPPGLSLVCRHNPTHSQAFLADISTQQHVCGLTLSLQHFVAQTWAGTIACFCGTLAGSAAFLRLFMSTGHLPPLGPEPGAVPWLPLLATSIVAALVESLPVQVGAGVLVGWLVGSAVLKTKHAG